jgi:hypothetical protein
MFAVSFISDKSDPELMDKYEMMAVIIKRIFAAKIVPNPLLKPSNA